MMFKKGFWVFGFLCVVSVVAYADGPKVEISYELTQVDLDTWTYIYDVHNISLADPITAFTIQFDYGLYDNLSVSTLSPLADAWDELVCQPEPVIEDDGFYDVLSELGNPGIGINEFTSGFSVTFDWLGAGMPSSQYFEITDPDNSYQMIESGCTVPEPGSFLLLITGFAWIKTRRSKY